MTGGYRHAVALAPYTTLRLGGPAEHFYTADTDANLIAAIRDVEGHGDHLLILGGGSNVVISDDGYRGTVVRVATSGITVQDGLVSAAAGVPWDEVVARAVDEGLSGIECLSGIPGLAGATPIQNVGAYGQDVSETIVMVDAYDRVTKSMVLLDNADCVFTYRHSVFKDAVFKDAVFKDAAFKDAARYVVTRVHFQLTDRGGLSAPVRYKDLAAALDLALGERAPLKAVREAVLEQRRRRGMVLDPADHDTWSAGSFFTNPILSAAEFAALEERCETPPPRYPEPDGRIKTSAAWLIEQAGFAKGHGAGPATLSTKHTLALTNRGGASTADLLRLAAELRDGVAARFGIALAPEPILVGDLTW
jgi:UDP-N-acetylmuramate dehydrogenase